MYIHIYRENFARGLAFRVPRKSPPSGYYNATLLRFTFNSRRICVVSRRNYMRNGARFH